MTSTVLCVQGFYLPGQRSFLSPASLPEDQPEVKDLDNRTITSSGVTIFQDSLGFTLNGAKQNKNSKYNLNSLQYCSFINIIKINIFFLQKFWRFPPVLASGLFSIHLLEMKYFWLITPLCLAFLNVDRWYELNFRSNLSKILNKSPKTGKIWQYCTNHNFLHVFQLLLKILPS